MTEKEMIEEIRQNLEDINGMKGIHILGYIPLAEELVKQRYRKLPEGSVVLSKEEYSRLISTINRLKKYDEERDIRLHARLKDEARKETAKEFAEKLKSKCKELEDKYSHLCKSKKECLMETCRYEGVLAVKRELYEITKQYGVEE